MEEPLVSIIIPTYNRASLIGETLDSVRAQTYRNWECVVVDDGSIDNTKKAVQQYTDKDPRFILVNRPDTHQPGGNGARNYGFLKSRGDYVLWLDSDDLLHPDYLLKQITTLIANPEVNWAVCNSYIFQDRVTNRFSKLYESNNLTDTYPLKRYVLRKLGIHTTSAVFCRKFLMEVESKSGLFKEDLKQSQEWELFSRLLFFDSNYLVLDEELLFIRNSTLSITSDYFNQKPEITRSQIQALNYVYDFLLTHNVLDKELRTFFVNSGITILKRLMNANKDKELTTYCEQYISNCLSSSAADRLYRIKYLLGKELWKRTQRGHKILHYP